MDGTGWQFAGSVAAIAVLVLLASRLGFAGRPELLDEEEARSFAAEIPGGFDAVAVGLDRARNAALLRDGAGRVVLVTPVGAHFVARLLGPEFATSRDGHRLVLRDGRSTATLDLGPDADAWAEAIARQE
jgi:hypothetical protein